MHSLGVQGLCILLGDLNQNASQEKMSQITSFVDLIKRSGLYSKRDKSKLKWLILNEYDAMIKALSDSSWSLVDCLR